MLTRYTRTLKYHYTAWEGLYNIPPPPIGQTIFNLHLKIKTKLYNTNIREQAHNKYYVLRLGAPEFNQPNNLDRWLKFLDILFISNPNNST